MMAFQEGYVLSIVSNGKTQREFNENGIRTVKLPFGSEYSLRLKSTHHVRSLAEVTLDGVNICASGEGKFILPANDSIRIERFVGDLKKGKKFKFESLEKATREGTAQDPTSSENGLIRVRFWKELVKYPSVGTVVYTHNGQYSSFSGSSASTKGGIRPRSAGGGQSAGTTVPSDSNGSLMSFEPQGASYNVNLASVTCDSFLGTTVEGSLSSQKFVAGDDFEVESSYTEILIRLQGLEVAPKAAWRIGGGLGPLTVAYNGQALDGVREVRHTQDGLMLLLDSARVVLER